MKKIDAFCHVFPAGHAARLNNASPGGYYLDRVNASTPALTDLDRRFAVMDGFGDYAQILTLAGPPIEVVASGDTAVDLCRAANDEMADLCDRHPDRFPFFVASVPMHDGEAAAAEAERAFTELSAVGVQVHSPAAGRPLDDGMFDSLWWYCETRCLPVWIHPLRSIERADYPYVEDRSYHWVFSMIGWPYETAAAMLRLVFGGVTTAHPRLKFVVHHAGGMIPFLATRISGGADYAARCCGAKWAQKVQDPLAELCKFYADTALYGNPSAIRCAHEFFGPSHLLFATDMPYGVNDGSGYVKDTIDAVRKGVPGDALPEVFAGNILSLIGR